MDAQRAANIIGIPYYVWDFSERFKADVVDDFIAEYAAGRTPNPCMRCNERIKFAALLEKALALGFDAVCTGHYASIRDGCRRQPGAAPRRRLGEGPVLRARRAHRRAAGPRDVPAGRDAVEGRDARGGRRARLLRGQQARLPRHLLHPRRRHPRLAGRPGRRRRPATSSTAPAPSSATHDGAVAFTVGQRKGLRSASPPPTASRASCSRCARSRTRSSSARKEALGHRARSPGPSSPGRGVAPAQPELAFDCEVQIRAHADPVPAVARWSRRTRRPNSGSSRRSR